MQLVTDNRPENMDNIMKHVLASLIVEHITTSPYHHLNNAKWRGSIKPSAKLARDNTDNWEMYTTQALSG